MRPDDRRIHHVGASFSLDQLAERFEQRVEDTGLDPAPEAAENAVPLAVFVRQMTPLRSRPSDPQYALKIKPVVLRRPTPSPTFRRKQWSDNRPFLVRHPDPLAQDHTSLQDVALNQTSADLGIPFVHET